MGYKNARASNSFCSVFWDFPPELAKEVAEDLGMQLGKVHLERFPDGEIAIQIQENVRGRDVFVLQTVALDPNKLPDGAADHDRCLKEGLSTQYRCWLCPILAIADKTAKTAARADYCETCRQSPGAMPGRRG